MLAIFARDITAGSINSPAMILYHLTNGDLNAILAEGLKPHVDKVWRRSFPNLPPCVWFTSEGGQVLFETSKGVRASKDAVLRVMIPSTDRRLKSWWKWTRKRPGEWKWTRDDIDPNVMRSWWIYFGVVPPSRFHDLYHVRDRDTPQAVIEHISLRGSPTAGEA